MKYSMVKESGAAVILLVLLVLLINPYHVWMPDMVHMMAVTALLLVFGFFASIILREGARDEREGTHRMYAGRTAFLVGSLLLIAGICYQSIQGALDVWLPIILVAMILAKIGSRIYTDRYL
jgi:hypothetical protein